MLRGKEAALAGDEGRTIDLLVNGYIMMHSVIGKPVLVRDRSTDVISKNAMGIFLI